MTVRLPSFADLIRRVTAGRRPPGEVTGGDTGGMIGAAGDIDVSQDPPFRASPVRDSMAAGPSGRRSASIQTHRIDKAAIRRQAERSASGLSPLLAEAQFVAATVAPGLHGRRRVGPGESFWQFRRYGQGDSLSRIDWRQTGRSRHVFVREYEWEASQTVALWRDSGASMSYRSSDTLPSKRHRTDVLILALALLLNRAGERVSLPGASTPPITGRLDAERFIVALSETGPLRPSTLITIPKHASAVLIGDFLDDPDQLEAAVAALASKAVHGHLLQVLDPAEATLPFTGRVRFRDISSTREALVPRVQGIRDDYLRRLAERQDRLATAARRSGWTFGVHRTDSTVQSGLLYLYGALSGDPAMTAR